MILTSEGLTIMLLSRLGVSTMDHINLLGLAETGLTLIEDIKLKSNAAISNKLTPEKFAVFLMRLHNFGI